MRHGQEGGWIRWSLLPIAGAIVAGLIAGFLVGRQSSREAGGLPWLGEEESTSGPWGEVRYWRSILEMPSALVAERSAFAERTEWFIELATMEKAERMLEECGMSQHLRNDLLSTAVAWPAGGFVLRPTDELVASIPADVRGKFYARLTRWPRNDTYGIPTRFGQEGKLGWLDKSELPPNVIDLTRKLIYRHGDIEMFADYDLVLRKIPDNRTARRFLRVMSRQTSVMGSLVVRPQDDLDKMAAYWGRGGRETEVHTLLEAARMSEGIHEVPISMLLPPFAKDRVYRYRHPGDPEAANCHYSSMNFFATQPNEEFTNLVSCAAAIDREYTVVTNDYQLGDVVLFMRSATEVIHTCNIIADQLVFTKNGGAVGQPWVIRTIDRLKELYEVDEPITLVVVRRRDMLAAPAPAHAAEP